MHLAICLKVLIVVMFYIMAESQPKPQPEHDPTYDSPGLDADAEVAAEHMPMIAADEQPSGHDTDGHPKTS